MRAEMQGMVVDVFFSSRRLPRVFSSSISRPTRNSPSTSPATEKFSRAFPLATKQVSFDESLRAGARKQSFIKLHQTFIKLLFDESVRLCDRGASKRNFHQTFIK